MLTHSRYSKFHLSKKPSCKPTVNEDFLRPTFILSLLPPVAPVVEEQTHFCVILGMGWTERARGYRNKWKAATLKDTQLLQTGTAQGIKPGTIHSK